MANTEVRERIAEAAWRLFDEKGYENVSVDEIIAATGTSKGAFYHYFSAKDELLSALPDKFDNDYDAWAAQCPPVMPSADRIVALCRFVCKNMELKLSRQIITEIYSTQLVTRGPKFLTSESRRYVKLLNQYVHEGQERGEITGAIACTELSQMLDIQLRGLIYDWCLRDGAYSMEAMCDKLIGAFMRAMRPGE